MTSGDHGSGFVRARLRPIRLLFGNSFLNTLLPLHFVLFKRFLLGPLVLKFRSSKLVLVLVLVSIDSFRFWWLFFHLFITRLLSLGILRTLLFLVLLCQFFDLLLTLLSIYPLDLGNPSLGLLVQIGKTDALFFALLFLLLIILCLNVARIHLSVHHWHFLEDIIEKGQGSV